MERLKRWLIRWLLNDFRAEIEDVVARNERVRKLEIKEIERVRDAIVKRQDEDSSDLGEMIATSNDHKKEIDLLVSHDKQTFAEMEALRVKINNLKGRVGDTVWKSKTTRNVTELSKEVRRLQACLKEATAPNFTSERMSSIGKLVEGFPTELNRIYSQLRQLEKSLEEPAGHRLVAILETMKKMGDELDCLKVDIEILKSQIKETEHDDREERGSLVDRY